MRRRSYLLATALMAACQKPGPPPPVPPPLPSASVVAPAPPTFETLLADYRALGLPEPGAGARLVRWESSGVMVLADGVHRPIWYLGFQEPGAADVLIGTERHAPGKEGRVVPLEPGPEAAESIHGEWDQPFFGINAALATAIQAKGRGWDALAGRLLEIAQKTGAGHHFSFFFQPPETPHRQALATLARAHFANELTRPGSDWRSIATRFEASLALGGPIRGDLSPFLRSLRATLEHPKAPAGSIEEKIDALCQMSGSTGLHRRDEPPEYLRIVELGFDAVPALIEHLADERLTRTVHVGFDNFATYHERLEGIVSDLLRGIAGEDLGKDWLRRQQGWAVERADVVAWWTQAQATGEERYLIAHALPTAADAQTPNRVALLALAHKHPARLEEVYRAALARSAMHTDSIADAIASSPLARADKLRLLTLGAEHASFDHRFASLRALRELDPGAYARQLTRALDALPRTPVEPYWRASESAASRLACEASDPRVWAALLRATRRADAGLRQQLLGTLSYTYLEDRQRRERLAFLAAFLDDRTLPETSKNPPMWEGPRIGFTLPPLSVRDVAAMTLGSLLHVPAVPKKDWTRAEWDALHAEIARSPEIAALHRPRR